MEKIYFKWPNATGEIAILTGSTEPGDAGRLNIGVPFAMKDELKASLSDAKWNKDDRTWHAKDDFRTKNVLDFWQGKNIYARYDLPLVEFQPNRQNLYTHQLLMCRHMLTRRYCVLAAEMGTGKTLATIEVLEHAMTLGQGRWWYVAPKSALESVKYDYSKWKAKVIPQFMTYEEMVRTLRGWDSNMAPPFGVIFDESSRVKTASAQRSQAALHLANNIREYYGDRGFAILMSGSPAPKSPVDWWSQCEIAYPGFLREGSPEKFRDRIALMRMEENMGGIKYPKLITFRDNARKCNICGKLDDHEIHKTDDFTKLTHVPAGGNADQQVHDFIPSRNEVEEMHRRLTGLVLVQFKKDCLDLPEKVYTQIQLPVTPYMKRLAKMVAKSAPTAAMALILLRELSDGFQYHDRKDGVDECEYCLDPETKKGTGKEKYWHENLPEQIDDGETLVFPQCDRELRERPCTHCSGKGNRIRWVKETVECDTPKLEALKDILENKEEDGRLIVYAGFTGTIDRICGTVMNPKGGKKWNYIRIDGRGWHSDLGITDPQRLIKIFQEDRETYSNVVIVAHPGSAGMGLTLTASDTTVYYSNDFNAESRIQSEDRNYRIGTRGCNIIDLLHLPVDKLVVDNLKSKRDMMKVTMGDLERVLED